MADVPLYEVPLVTLRRGCHVARAGGREIIIIETDKGLRVYDGVCPHLGGPLIEGRISKRAVVCPWHSYVFDPESGRCRTVPGRIWRTARPAAAAEKPMSISLRVLRHEVENQVIKVYDS